MYYRKVLNASNIGLIIILLDQSGAMGGEFEDHHQKLTKVEFATKIVNDIIYNLILTCRSGDSIKNCCFLVVIGYGNGLVTLVADYINSVAINFKRMDKLSKTEPDGAGGFIQIPYDVPIWVDPQADNGCPMGEAFVEARKVVSAWVENYPNSPAPMVWNITAGIPANEWSVRLETAEIKKLKTTDGNTLLFNSLIKKLESEDNFPINVDNIVDKQLQFIYSISSTIPIDWIESVNSVSSSIILQIGAKGCTFGIDFKYPPTDRKMMRKDHYMCFMFECISTKIVKV